MNHTLPNHTLTVEVLSESKFCLNWTNSESISPTDNIPKLNYKDTVTIKVIDTLYHSENFQAIFIWDSSQYSSNGSLLISNNSALNPFKPTPHHKVELPNYLSTTSIQGCINDQYVPVGTVLNKNKDIRLNYTLVLLLFNPESRLLRCLAHDPQMQLNPDTSSV